MSAQQRRPVVHYPSELTAQLKGGVLRGRYHPESNEYNVLAYGPEAGGTYPVIGRLLGPDESPPPPPDATREELIGVWEDGALRFRQGKRLCTARPYQLQRDVFSRNEGILETDRMLEKRVVVSGCGSVGSLVALELARAGVGHFLLVDPDTLAYHNLCRHQCGVDEVGMFKVSAVRDRIHKSNPLASVNVQPVTIERLPQRQLDEFFSPGTVVVGCADNREGDVWASGLAVAYRVPFVSIGCWERAFAGEIFYSLPGLTPCYSCPFGEGGLSSRASTNRRFYTHEEELAAATFMPGISADINFVTTIGIKVILDLLNRDDEAYIPRVINDLSQFTLVCNTNDVRVAGERAEIFSYPLQVTRSIDVDYRPPCPPCKLERHGQFQ
jgi:molybdopterin/thiamine biosynthesis adenylyltransferase